MGDIAGKILATLITITVAVSASGAVWLTANLIVGRRSSYIIIIIIIGAIVFFFS